MMFALICEDDKRASSLFLSLFLLNWFSNKGKVYWFTRCCQEEKPETVAK